MGNTNIDQTQNSLAVIAYKIDGETYCITCYEGTAWTMDVGYVDIQHNQVYSPYTGQRCHFIPQLGAMQSQLPVHNR